MRRNEWLAKFGKLTDRSRERIVNLRREKRGYCQLTVLYTYIYVCALSLSLSCTLPVVCSNQRMVWKYLGQGVWAVWLRYGFGLFIFGPFALKTLWGNANLASYNMLAV